jgi:hypothetical protein
VRAVVALGEIADEVVEPAWRPAGDTRPIDAQIVDDAVPVGDGRRRGGEQPGEPEGVDDGVGQLRVAGEHLLPGRRGVAGGHQLDAAGGQRNGQAEGAEDAVLDVTGQDVAAHVSGAGQAELALDGAAAQAEGRQPARAIEGIEEIALELGVADRVERG